MKNTRILPVEDDPSASFLLGSWLARLGAVVIETASVAEAEVAMQAPEPFDLIISDVHLPGNNRLEWIERVLQREDAPPLLLLSGNPELETALRAANLPVAGYLVKPPDFTALGQMLEHLIHDHRQRTSLRRLARDAAQLATNNLDADLGAKLSELARCLNDTTHQRRGTLEGGASAPWRTAIIETITVLERTKHSFRSKELGVLRQRLETLLTPPQAA